MKSQNNCVTRESGQIFGVLIIIIALLGVGLWMLVAYKKGMDREARAFGRQMIERLANNHDAAFLADHLSPQARLDNPPSQQQYIISKFQEFGAPAQPIPIDENITWESHFFEPRGTFTAHLNYPAQTATVQLAVSHPVGKWQLDNIAINWSQPR